MTIGFYGEKGSMGVGNTQGSKTLRLLSLLDFVTLLFLSIHIHIQKLVRLLNFPALYVPFLFSPGPLISLMPENDDF